MGTRGVAGRTTLSGLTWLYTRHETHCAVHAGQWEAAHRADPQLDESWCGSAANDTSYCRFLRRLVRELRRTQVSSLSSLPAQEEKVRQSLLNSLVTHLGRAFAIRAPISPGTGGI